MIIFHMSEKMQSDMNLQINLLCTFPGWKSENKVLIDHVA